MTTKEAPDLSATFLATARMLFEKKGLSINGTVYEFSEVEFYLCNSDHPDLYAHQHPEQLQYGNWYFHRASTKIGSAYKGGTRKGLDMTLGDSKPTYCGVLVRSIYASSVGTITGPSCVVDHILKCYGVASLMELTNDQALSVSSNTRKFHLVDVDHASTEAVYSGPRVGLTAASHPEWATKPYRFVRRYAGVKKDKTKLTKVAS